MASGSYRKRRGHTRRHHPRQYVSRIPRQLAASIEVETPFQSDPSRLRQIGLCPLFARLIVTTLIGSGPSTSHPTLNLEPGQQTGSSYPINLRFRYFEIVALVSNFEYPSYFFDFSVSSTSIKHAVFVGSTENKIAFIHI